MTLWRGDVECRIEWGGPANAYVVCKPVRPDEPLRLGWPVPRFKQVFVPQSVPGREQSVTVDWLGSTVIGVSPKGPYLPMFEAGKGS